MVHPVYLLKPFQRMPQLFDRSILDPKLLAETKPWHNHVSSCGIWYLFCCHIFFLHMFDYIFKQCIAGSLIDQMNSFWWLSCSKMNLTPLPRGIPALCHRMHAGWPRPCHQATQGPAVSCWWFGLLLEELTEIDTIRIPMFS